MLDCPIKSGINLIRFSLPNSNPIGVYTEIECDVVVEDILSLSLSLTLY